MRAGGRSGFSLVEVVIALVVIALGLLAIAGTLGWVSRNQAKLRYQKIAALIADSELNRLEADPDLPMRELTYSRPVGKPRSDLPEDAVMIVTARPYPRPDEPRLRYVKVEVRWGAPGDPLGGRVVRERLICLR